MHERPIVFDKGLVDPLSLLEYSTQCHCQDLNPPRELGSCFDEFHHLLFSKPAFKNCRVPLVLKMLRTSKYTQFQMLSCQEDFYHQQSAEEVPQDKIDTQSAERFVQETKWLDGYVATSWGLAEAQQQLDRPSGSMARARRAGLAASLALHHQLNAEAIGRIDGIEVMSFSAVTGALQQYLARRHEESMARLVEQRLKINPVIMTTRVHDESHFRVLAEDKMRVKINSLNWALRGIIETVHPA